MNSLLSTALILAAVSSAAVASTARPLVYGDSPKFGRLIIKNKGNADLSAITMVRCDRAKLAYDVLEKGQTLATDGEKALNVSEGCWNIQMGGGGYETATKRLIINQDEDLVLNYR